MPLLHPLPHGHGKGFTAAWLRGMSQRHHSQNVGCCCTHQTQLLLPTAAPEEPQSCHSALTPTEPSKLWPWPLVGGTSPAIDRPCPVQAQPQAAFAVTLE